MSRPAFYVTSVSSSGLVNNNYSSSLPLLKILATTAVHHGATGECKIIAAGWELSTEGPRPWKDTSSRKTDGLEPLLHKEAPMPWSATIGSKWLRCHWPSRNRETLKFLGCSLDLRHRSSYMRHLSSNEGTFKMPVLTIYLGDFRSPSKWRPITDSGFK